jgi:hypothetical protein
MNINQLQFTKAFKRFVSGLAMIERFRTMAQLGMEDASKRYKEKIVKSFELMKPGKEHSELLIGPDSFWNGNGYDQLIHKITYESTKNSLDIIDSMSIVFAHSILDSFIYEFIQISAKIDPNSFVKYGKERKIKFIEIIEKSKNEIVESKINEIVTGFERESIIVKCDILHTICHDVSEKPTMKNFNFDRGRIEKFDKLRHKIVHELYIEIEFDDIDVELKYCRELGFHFFVLMNRKFNLKLDFPSLSLIEGKQDDFNLYDWDALMQLCDWHLKNDH